MADNSSEFKYLLDQFADIKVMRFRVPGWESLSLRQKAYAYHLSEAAKWGRDIYWDQNFKYNLDIRHAIETILDNYKGEKDCEDYSSFLIYSKRVFFSSGIHHHYAEDKFFPECPKDYFKSLLKESSFKGDIDFLLDVIYSKDKYLQRRYTGSESDPVVSSSVNFYDGVTKEEVESYYNSMIEEGDTHPISVGLNSKVVKGPDGNICEQIWNEKSVYASAIEKICEELSLAANFANTKEQADALNILIEYYKSGDLKKWDEYNIAWLNDTTGMVDYINGFIEDYNDPLARKGAWEGYVNIRNIEASERTEKLSKNAQWFEDNSPVDPRFKKKNVKGVSAKVVTAVCISGDSYPATPIGINLPNSDWIRKEHGSKSVTITNITAAFDKAAQECPNSVIEEFAFSDQEKAMSKKYSSLTDEIHTDLHECLGHGSGQLLPGTSPGALGEYSSTLEEARADLFGLYYVADPKLVELGILPDMEAYKAQYSSYIRNGLMVQFNRIELGKDNTEAHMQNRELIAAWCYEKGKPSNVIEKIVKEGKTFFVVNDFVALRGLFADLLAEVQRIKSEGDYAAGKDLVLRYGVKINRELHEEVLRRYSSLGLKPYGGFINPTIEPVKDSEGVIIDYKMVYEDDYLCQQIHYGKKYATL